MIFDGQSLKDITLMLHLQWFMDRRHSSITIKYFFTLNQISKTLYLINNKLLDIHQQQAAGKWNY